MPHQLGEAQLVNLLERVNEQTKKTTTVKVRDEHTALTTRHGCMQACSELLSTAGVYGGTGCVCSLTGGATH